VSELEDVQTTVAVIEGLRERIAELELVTRHSTRTLDLPGSPAPKAADLLPDVEHYDGCWQYHFDCAIERIAELTAMNEGLYADVRMYGAANGELKDLLADATEQMQSWHRIAEERKEKG